MCVCEVCEERDQEGRVSLTFKDLRRIDLFRVSLLRHGYLVRDLDKVDVGGEVRDAARHDREELTDSLVVY